ncbi:BRO family protein [Timonella sp. A28]|uniref:BRO family protein n=1 Tax=Timonella sp. A28 TaxID=3442640 RepID=UPI003EB7081C
MTSLQPFMYGPQQVRSILIDNEPWFVLNDVCAVLEISNPWQVADRIDQDALCKTEVIDSLGRKQNTNAINEAGLYEVIIRSNSPLAKPFKDWVLKEVLPSIRKTGSYASQPLTELEVAERYVHALREKQALAAKVEADAPLVAQAETFRQADGLRTIGDLANDLKIHAQTNYPGVKILRDDLFALAGQVGLIIRGNTVRNNQPTARAIESGWVKPKDTPIETKNHGSFVKVSARLTPRGYGRLWDAAINNLREHGTVLPPVKEIAA